MLEWKINNSDNALRKKIKRCQDIFDRWFESSSWNDRITKEQMLSKDSPLPHVYYKMCKPFDEVKEKFPHIEECSSCGERMEEWIETKFSFCYDYECGMKLCKKCANELKNKIIDWEDNNEKIRF